MLKRMLRSAFNALGFEISRTKEPLPSRNALDIFYLCAKDLMLGKRHPFVLQVGANDGIAADPIRNLITEYQWCALLIEPQPLAFAQLESNYAGFPHVRMRNCAIASVDGNLCLYSPTDALVKQNARLSRLSSLTRSQLVKELIREGYPTPQNMIQEIVVSALSVPSLISTEGIVSIDVLQIDAEGYDWKILSQFDLVALGVSLINMEFFHLSAQEQRECIKRLTELGYATAFYLGDLIAYRAAGFGKC